jgi:hypothetical protein
MTELARFAGLPVEEKVGRLASAAMVIERRDERLKVERHRQGQTLNYPDRVLDYLEDIARNLLGTASAETGGANVLAMGSAAHLLHHAGCPLTDEEFQVLERDIIPLVIASSGTRDFLALISGFELDLFRSGYEAIPQATARLAMGAKLLQSSGLYGKVFAAEFSFNAGDAPLPSLDVSERFPAFNFVCRDFAIAGRHVRVSAFGIEFSG